MKTPRTYLTTGLLALIFAGFLFFLESTAPIVKVVDLKGRDLFFGIRHTLSPLPSEADQIVLVKLDDETLHKLEARWPYPRTLYAEVLKRLEPFSPKAIGFDLIFSGSDLSAGSDNAFREALERLGNVVIASHQSSAGEVGPTDLIRRSAWQVGVVDKPRDLDHTIRRTFFSFSIDGKQVPSWESAIFEKAFQKIPTSSSPKRADIMIDYHLRFDEFPQISFWRLLEGSVLAKEVRNKIVLVGLTAEVFHDIHATPLGSMPGVAVNANVLAMLMREKCFSFVSERLIFPLLFFSFWIAFLIAVSNTFGTALLIVTFLASAYLAISFIFFFFYIILDLWLAVLGMVLILLGAVIYREGARLLDRLKLQRESARDPLTHFYGRKFMALKLKFELSYPIAKNKVEISVVIFDLDNFKLINESFGRKEGDRVLCTLAEAIRSSVRKNELICRYGDDEFCVVLPSTSVEGASKFAEKIRRLISDNPDLAYQTSGPENSIRVTASVGVASSTHLTVVYPDKLFAAADRALLKAKSQGGDQVCIFGAA